MVDIATLGIKVDSSGAEKGSADLDKLTISAKDATKSVDGLGAASSKAGAQVQSNSGRIAQAVQQNMALESSVHKVGAAHDNLAHQVHGVEAGLKATGLAAVTHAMGFGAISSQTVNAAKQFENFEFKSSQLRTGLRVLRPLAVEAGASLGNLGMLAGAGRAGMGVLAAVITGTVIIALEKAADKAVALKERLGELSRNPAAGGEVFHLLDDAAKKAGSSVDDLAGSYEILKKAQRELLSEKGFRFAPGAGIDGFLGFSPKEAVRAVDTMNELLKISRVPADQLKTTMNDFFTTVAKGGGLTKDAFDKLETVAPRAARAIHEAFGFSDIESFRKKLDEAPISAEKIIKAFGRIGPAVDEELKKLPKSVEQSLDKLKTDFDRLMEEIGKSSGSKMASNFINGFSSLIRGEWSKGDILSGLFDVASVNFKFVGDLMERLTATITKALQDVFAQVRKLWSEFWSGLGTAGKTENAALDTAASAQLDTRFQDKLAAKYRGAAGLTELPPAIKATDDALNKLTTDVVADAVKITEAANAAAAAAAKAASVAGSGSGDYGDSTGITAGAVSVGDTNVTGGIYKMPSGGTADSLRLTGKVSPGETVAIIPEDKMSGSLLAQLHDTIGSSPINVGPGGSSYISAPASYTDAEARRGKLAMDITAAQQAEARARIAANVAATSGSTSNTSTSTISSAQKVLNAKGVGGGSGGHTFKPTSKPLWFDQDPNGPGGGWAAGGGESYVDKQSGKTQNKTPSTTFIGNPNANGIGPKQEGVDDGGRDLREKLSLGGGATPLSFGGLRPEDFPIFGPTMEQLYKDVGPMPWQGGPEFPFYGPFPDQGGPIQGNFPQYSQQQPFDNFPQYGGSGGIGSDYVAGGGLIDNFGGGIGSDYAAGGGLVDTVGGIGSDYVASGGVGADTPYYMTLPDYTGGYADPQRFGIGAGRNNQMPYSGPDDYLSPQDYVDAGAFAHGGSFTVPNRGRGGVDGTGVRMNVTPGEQVSVTPNGEQIGGGKAGGGTHIENVYVVTQGENPMASLSRNAIRRELSAWTR